MGGWTAPASGLGHLMGQNVHTVHLFIPPTVCLPHSSNKYVTLGPQGTQWEGAHWEGEPQSDVQTHTALGKVGLFVTGRL